jgi:hypothetical protein
VKNCAAAQHTAKAVWAAGLRQKALLQRFLLATTAGKFFSNLYQCPSVVKNLIRKN